MLRFSRSYCIYFVLVSVLCTPGDADLSISTSTPTPCYGDVVTLVCHHPEVASNPGRYFSTGPAWRENGVGIRPSTGTIYLQTDTSVDLTRTTLTINISVDHFRNKSFSYSCLLVLAENGIPTGEVETSEEVTLDPVEPRPPSSIVNIDCSIPTSIAFNWTHTPVECYKDRIGYYVSWVNIDNTENGSDVTGEHMYNITGLAANSNYTLSVRIVVEGNVQSTAVSRNVTTGKPLVLPKTPSLSACYNRNFTLYCDVSPLHTLQFRAIYWMFNSHRIVVGFDTYAVSSNGRELVIHNVTASTASDYGCGIELNSGTLVEGGTYSMHPLDSPKEPHNITLTPGVAGISVSWEHDRSCFEDHVFDFIVSWQKACTCDHSELSTTVSGTIFNIQNLEPDTTYKICVSAVSFTVLRVESERKCLHIKTLGLPTSTTGGLSTDLIAGIVVVCVVVILLTFLAGCGVGVIVHVVYQKKSKQSTRATEGTVDEDKKNSPIPSYVNVELDDGSVPMTNNPGYMQVERMTEGPKPLYGNL